MTEEQKQKKKEQDRVYYEKNKEKIKQRVRVWNAENKERKAQMSKSWAKANPDKVKTINKRFVKNHLAERAEYNREWRTNNYILQYMLQNARNRAKKNNIPFTLTEDDISIPDVCPVLGVVLQKNDGKVKDNSPSLDRLIPEIGYVKGNVRVISWRANRLKSDASVDELQKLIEYMIRSSNESVTQQLIIVGRSEV